MGKSQLEILSISDIEKDKLEDYEEIGKWDTPYIKLKETEDKFRDKMSKFIRKKGKEIYANLAIIKSTHKHPQKDMANQNIVFYRKS